MYVYVDVNLPIGRMILPKKKLADPPHRNHWDQSCLDMFPQTVCLTLGVYTWGSIYLAKWNNISPT